MKKTTLLFLGLALLCLPVYAQWGVAPAGWTNFAIGLTDESSAINPAPPSRYNNIRIARTAGANFTGLTHRVRYINNGVNSATNWYSWLPGGAIVDNYITDSEALGMRPAFNIYMLQEDGGAATAVANMADINYMRNFFWNVVQVAQKANGHKAVFIIEPDTWGYLIAANYGANPTSPGNPALRPNLIPSHVNDLGAGYAYLAGLPNTCSGVARGIIRTIRTYAPDAYVGFHTNHWAVWSNGATGPAFLGAWSGAIYQGQAGMPFWNTTDIDVNINFQVAWYTELFGGAATCDKGDFLAVEKYGQDEGARWQIHPSANVLYYGAAQYAKWLYWCKNMGQGLNLPLLGWQIPVGVSTIPNGLTINAACVSTWNYQYKDGFLEYFFANRQSFICAGFIGLFMGPGVGQAVTYYNTGSPCGDQGYLFGNVRSQLDPIQPINMNLPSIPACAATSTPTCSLPVEWISFTGSRQQKTDRLRWTTASERDNKYFEVEHSSDGIHYYPSARIDAARNGNTINHYEWENMGIGNTYYRIKQIDADGKYEYSKSILLSDQGAALSMEMALFPNPANDKVYVQLTTMIDVVYTIELYDVNGRLVFSKTINASDNYLVNEFNLTTLSAGIYYVQAIRLSDGASLREKLVVR